MTLEAQLEIEADMIGSGVQRYLAATARAEDAGRASDTSYGAAFINTHLRLVAGEIIKRIELASSTNSSRHVKGAAYWRALKNMDAHVLAFITLRSVIDAAISQETQLRTVLSIGERVQDEVRLRQFQKADEELFDKVIKGLKYRNAKSYDFQRNSLIHQARYNVDGSKKNIELFEWNKEHKIKVGGLLLDVTIATTKHVSIESVRVHAKTVSTVKIGDELAEWIQNHKEAMGVLFPSWAPMVVQPNDWSASGGGFMTPDAQKACKFMVTKRTGNAKGQLRTLGQANLSRVYEAVNHLQKTRWCVNARVLDVAQQVWELGLGTGMPSTIKTQMPAFPFHAEWRKETGTAIELKIFEDWKQRCSMLYTQEGERLGQCAMVSRVLTMAERFKDYPELFYVWHLDFRSRMYAMASGMSPQGADVGKALLMFAEGKRLGERGEFWFKVLGANLYGKDKVSYTDRAAWVDSESKWLASVAADPIGMRNVWGAADKPYAFLAWCLEYARYCTEGQDFVSHLPVGLDGTCNGLQHYSAMLRDVVGGTATNLVDAETPSDIYGQVAAVVIKKLKEANTSVAKRWLEFGIDRTVCKRPVMTLPYGSTKQSCREYLYQSYAERKTNLFGPAEVGDAITYLTNVVWEAIGEVVIAARAAMQWLQKVSGALYKASAPMVWTTPSGFVVHQEIRKTEVIKVETVLMGRTQITLREETPRIDPSKQRTGIAPNFVHSMDASHLVATVLKAKELGINDIAAIHDDYGTYAADTDAFHKIIRETFVEQYSVNRLELLKQELNERYPDAKIPDPPKPGDLDLNEVLKSKYFFG